MVSGDGRPGVWLSEPHKDVEFIPIISSVYSLEEKFREVAGAVAEDERGDTKRDRMNETTACFSAHSFSVSPGTIGVADLVTNNKSRRPLIGLFSSQHDLLNSSIAAP